MSTNPLIGHPHVLLDFDGIVYKNKRMHGHIVNKSVAFVQDRLKIEPIDAYTVNDTAYRQKGHTSLAVGGDKRVLQDYNEFVFHDIDYTQFVNHEDIEHIRGLCAIKKERDLSFYVCTNAPLHYCEGVMSALGLPFDELFSTNHIFTSDRLQWVKPQPSFYENVEEQMKEIIDFKNRQKLHFIDDSFLNIANRFTCDKWSAYHITDLDNLNQHLRFFEC